MIDYTIKEEIDKTVRDFGYPLDFLNEYDQIECLASSNGKETFLVKNKSNDTFAICKCFDKSKYLYSLDIDILKSLKHKGIPNIINNYESEKMLCIVREYVEGLTLDEYLKNNELTENEKIELCNKLADILIYLHNQDKPIIHRDIKPKNIVITANKEVYLIDYDIARILKEDSETDTVFFGTKGFAPPEQYGFKQTDQRTDIYAFGMLIKTLFDKDNANKKIQHIIDKCTAFSPADRYSNMYLVKQDLLGKNKRKLIISLVAIVLIVLSSIYIRNLNKVTIKEPLIEEAIRLQLNLSDNQTITKDDLLNVKELYIYGDNAYRTAEEMRGLTKRKASKGSLNNLDDLAKLTNLEVLMIVYQKESLDISGLSDLKCLRSIELKHLQILDLSPLSTIKSLNSIFLYDSGISDCLALETLDELEHLDVGYTSINSIDKIGNYSNLRELSIKDLNMFNLDGIEKMPNLEVLWMNGSGIADVSALKKLTSLKVIHINQKYYDVISKIFKDKEIDIIVE